jgi:PiT family inorganic phosphate transporter
MTDALLTAGVALSLLFAFTNGMKDGANVLATAVSSGSLSFRSALWLVTLAELAGPFLLGIPVALTVARGIIRVELLPRGADAQLLVASGVAGALVWNTACWLLRLPTSSSFALVGGLVGPALYRFGLAGVPWTVFLPKVIGALILSPFLGILFGGLTYRLLVRLLREAPWRTVRHLKRLHVASLIVLGLNHGTNDSQKTMGLIALLLYLTGTAEAPVVPLWVMAASAASLAAGITMGGTKIIRTVGYNIFRVRPEHSFCAQLSASLILFACNLAGAPVSTTQIVSSAVIGVGDASRRSGVRWQVIRAIFVGWAITIPAAGGLATLAYIGLRCAFRFYYSGGV